MAGRTAIVAAGVLVAGLWPPAGAIGAPAQGVVGPVDPSASPVEVRTADATAASRGPLRLRVTRPGGTTVALTDPRDARNGTVAFRWYGRGGPGATGSRVSDGRYLVRLETAGGAPVATTPTEVLVDRTPPRVGVVVPAPTIPAPPQARVNLKVRDRDWGPRHPVQTRLIVRSLAGATLGAGPWSAVTGSRGMPQPVVRSGRAGAVNVSVQARDAAGNRSESEPVAVALPGAPGPAQAITRVRTARPMVALTIDDGYDTAALDSMIATATRMRAPITLCVNGVVVGGYSAGLRARLQAAAAAGWVHSCSHGYSHDTGTSTPRDRAYRDLASNVVWDRAIGRSSVPFYRPPYGAISPGIMAAATNLGYRYVLLWDVDTNDWQGRTASQITGHVLSRSSRGSIVLMHTKPASAAALPDIIRGLRARGLEPVAIGDLIAAGRPTR